jgi:hypothetical protein
MQEAKMRTVMISRCLLASVAFLFSMASPQAKRSPLDPYNQWVLRCLKDFEAIKPGLTRSDVEKKLIRDGGSYDKGLPEV